MQTASFFTYTGPGRISIARWAPRGLSGFEVYPALNPHAAMLKMVFTEFLPRYQVILARLDPWDTWEQLHRLADGCEPVLLCWERPPFTARTWCHRRLVAEWFEDRLKVRVPEIVEPSPQLTLF